MAGRDETDNHTQHRSEWEVVSLTASAYAAAPGPLKAEWKDDRNYDATDELETSRALFMSGHFVFPPSEHEDLPVEPFLDDKIGKDDYISNELPGPQFHRETGNSEQSTNGKSTIREEPNECPDGGIDFASNAKHSVCEAWWRRRVVSVCTHAKEDNAFWSLFIAAALTGLIVLGQRWQQERYNFR